MRVINLYTATYYRFEKTKKAIESIIESVNTSKHDVMFYIGDNNSQDEEMQKWLNTLASNPRVELFKSNKNIGKASVVNKLHQETRDCDYFASVDSDMLADENDQYNWLDEMVNVFEGKGGENIALVSSQQKGNCAHQVQMLKHKSQIGHNEIMFNPYFAVAGGCIMMRNKEFIQVGRYQIIDIYTGDDALLMRNIAKKLKKIVAVASTIRLTHMPNEPYEKEYQQWKVDKSFGKIKRGFGDGGFWDK